MYLIVAGGGKVGANVARIADRDGPRGDARRAAARSLRALEEEFGPVVVHGDATEVHVLERAGIERPPDIVLAVTGDDEDNLVIAQIAKEGYGVPKAIARVNDPRNQQHFDLLGIRQTVCATSGILGPRRARGARARPRAPARAAAGGSRGRRDADRRRLARRRQAGRAASRCPRASGSSR